MDTEPDGAFAPDLSAVHFDEQNCAICLEPMSDRCVLPRCFHTCFCFGCILEWIRTQKSTKTCPLCVTPLGSTVLHNLDPTVQKFTVHHISGDEKPSIAHLVEELNQDTDGDTDGASSPQPAVGPGSRRVSLESLRRREEIWHRRKMNEALERRRFVYRHHLYAKHVASNRYTRYRPYPGPAGFRTNPTYARLLSVFLQRELQVWPHLDVEFLSYYIPALLAHVDIRSDAFRERLTEWIDDRNDTQHLVHEMELFVRSGRGGLGLDQYDHCPWLQYDAPQ